jgi:hypothetical protein
MIEFIGTSITITVNYNTSHIELLLSNVCLTDIYYFSLHECTPFYNYHATQI